MTWVIRVVGMTLGVALSVWAGIALVVAPHGYTLVTPQGVWNPPGEWMVAAHLWGVFAPAVGTAALAWGTTPGEWIRTFWFNMEPPRWVPPDWVVQPYVELPRWSPRPPPRWGRPTVGVALTGAVLAGVVLVVVHLGVTLWGWPDTVVVSRGVPTEWAHLWEVTYQAELTRWVSPDRAAHLPGVVPTAWELAHLEVTTHAVGTARAALADHLASRLALLDTYDEEDAVRIAWYLVRAALAHTLFNAMTEFAVVPPTWDHLVWCNFHWAMSVWVWLPTPPGVDTPLWTATELPPGPWWPLTPWDAEAEEYRRILAELTRAGSVEGTPR